MEKKSTIKNVNIEGKNNDMIDKLESLFNDVNFGNNIKKTIKDEINKLRKEIKNKNINWTQNEQDELKQLLENIFLNNENSENNEENEKEKINLIISLFNIKINNELSEFKESELKKPEKLIEGINNDKVIKQSGNITDEFIGNSKYLVILFPVVHLNKKDENYINIDDKDLSILIKQNTKLNNIISELIKCGYSKTYVFEGLYFKELSLGIDSSDFNIDVKFLDKYEKLLKNPEDNKEKIKQMQQAIAYFSMFSIYPEYLHGNDLLSYGIEEFTSHRMTADIFEFLQLFIKKNINKDNLIDLIDTFLQEKKNEYKKKFLEKINLDNYINNLKKNLIPENISKITIDEYMIFLLRKLFEFRHNIRNQDVVSNIETLYNNSTPNGIMLRFGSAHFGVQDNLLIDFINKGILTKSDLKNIKNIKQILKEKGISYIEITPKKED